jgi:hypothetical protein
MDRLRYGVRTRERVVADLPELPLVGDEFAGYRLRAVLGRGGMSVVYQAENPRPAPGPCTRTYGTGGLASTTTSASPARR